MVFKFSEAFVQANPEVFNFVEEGFASRIVYYIIHSEFRKSVKLTPWLEEQMQEAQDDLDLKQVLDQIPTLDDPDEQVNRCLRWVYDNIKYVGDIENWKMSEYWQTYAETLQLREGDCEDGAILMYVICRMKGVPASRLRLMAGSVVGGGHCWLAYRPNEYPLNWAFMDWCYWYTPANITQRPLFDVQGQVIRGYTLSRDMIIGPYDNYRTIWFAFNEDKSNRTLTYMYNEQR